MHTVVKPGSRDGFTGFRTMVHNGDGGFWIAFFDGGYGFFTKSTRTDNPDMFHEWVTVR